MVLEKVVYGNVADAPHTMAIHDNLTKRSLVRPQSDAGCVLSGQRYLLFLSQLSLSHFWETGDLNCRASYLATIAEKEQISRD